MIAFVLSGGGSQGALQVGALKALFEQGIRPDMVVGTSVGALNGAYLAFELSEANIERMSARWCALSHEDIYPGNPASALWQLLRRGNGLYSNERLKHFLLKYAPQNIKTFSNITACRLYIVATQLPHGLTKVFGDETEESVLDAVMASVALPPFHPPYEVGEQSYLDGSLAAHLPLRVAVERGASTIYALHVFNNLTERRTDRGALSVSMWAILKLLQNQAFAELEWAYRQAGVTLHHLALEANQPPSVTDFSRGQELIDEGYSQTRNYLQDVPVPLSFGLSRRWQQARARLFSWPQQFRQVFARNI